MKAYSILLLLCWTEFIGTEPAVATSTTAFTVTADDHSDGSSPDYVSVSMTVNTVKHTVAQSNGSEVFSTTVQATVAPPDESTVFSTSPISELTASATSTEPITDTSESSSIPHTDASTTGPLSPTNSASPSPTTSPSPPNPDHHDCMFNGRTGRIMLMVTGALILVCVILLLVTVLLAMKLCQARRQEQGSDADLISNSDYWMGTAQRNQRHRSETEGGETGVLMSPLSQGKMMSGSAGKKPETGKLDLRVIQELEAVRNSKEFLTAATPAPAPAAAGTEQQTSGTGNSSSSKKSVDAAAQPSTATTNSVASSPSENETGSAAVLVLEV